MAAQLAAWRAASRLARATRQLWTSGRLFDRAHKSQRGRRDGSIPPPPSVREARSAPAASLHASVSSFPGPPCSTPPFTGYLLIKSKKNVHLARLLPAYDANLPSGFCSSLFFFVVFFLFPPPRPHYLLCSFLAESPLTSISPRWRREAFQRRGANTNVIH